MGHSGRIISDAAAAANAAVEVRLVESGDRISALIAAAVIVSGMRGFQNTLAMTLPLTGAKIRVRTVCELLPDIEIEAEREIDLSGLVLGKNKETEAR